MAYPSPFAPGNPSGMIDLAGTERVPTADQTTLRLVSFDLIGVFYARKAFEQGESGNQACPNDVYFPVVLDIRICLHQVALQNDVDGRNIVLIDDVLHA